MTHLRSKTLVGAALLACSAVNGAPAADIAGTLVDNQSIFVDGRTFSVTTGMAKGADAADHVRNLGARELGPGALIFRSGEKLFIAEAPLRFPAAVGRTAAVGSADASGAAGTRGNIRIEYVPPKKEDLQGVYQRIKDHHGLEILQQLLSPFQLPEQLALRTRECGMVNAWYAREESGPALNVCYEYLKEIEDNAPEEEAPTGVTRADALVGQFLYLVAHEFGHAVLDLYNVPIFGSQEDAADRFAAYLLLWFEKDRARRLVGGAAYSYRKILGIYKNQSNVAAPLSAFSSTHGLPQQRFFNLLCMAYGADPKEFAFLVSDNYLPKTRAPACGIEFATLKKAMQQAIAPHIDQDLARQVYNTRWLR